jgi:adenosylcobyric acid synthase
MRNAVEWCHVRGYEIHHGKTDVGPDVQAHLTDGLGWEHGNVCGVYLHGLFDHAAYRQHFLARLGWQGQTLVDWSAMIDASIERVARLIPASGWVI